MADEAGDLQARLYTSLCFFYVGWRRGGRHRGQRARWRLKTTLAALSESQSVLTTLIERPSCSRSGGADATWSRRLTSTRSCAMPSRCCNRRSRAARVTSR
jgi:hypothetical protein